MKIKAFLTFLIIFNSMNSFDIPFEMPKIHYDETDDSKSDTMSTDSDTRSESSTPTSASSIVTQLEDENIYAENAKLVIKFIIHFKNEKALQDFIKSTGLENETISKLHFVGNYPRSTAQQIIDLKYVKNNLNISAI